MIGTGRANKRSVWSILNKGTTEKHFATFPQELPVDPIKAGTSEKGVCSKCGAPWYRLMDKELKALDSAPKNFIIDDRNHAADKRSASNNMEKYGIKPGHYFEYSNIRWEPSCKCNASIKPAIVLDPFAGIGTMVVTRKLMRDGIAIEKNPQSVQIAERVAYKELGVFR